MEKVKAKLYENIFSQKNNCGIMYTQRWPTNQNELPGYAERTAPFEKKKGVRIRHGVSTLRSSH